MSEMTPLDRTHAAMMAAEADDMARMRFYERLADSELFLLLRREAEGGEIEPELFELDGGQFVLVFDLAERLADFVEKPAPYAAISGRALAAMLAGQGIGMALNPEVAPSSILLPAAAVDWLAQTLAEGPEAVAARVRDMQAPGALPEALLAALEARLALAGGLARVAYLVGITYENGTTGHLMGVVGASARAEAAIAKMLAEAVVFADCGEVALDVGFFAQEAPMVARLARMGLRFDLPEPEKKQEVIRSAPGSDPDRPPILK